VVPVVVNLASFCVSWFSANAFAQLVIPEASFLAIGVGKASARAGLFVPVEARSTDSWATSANALFIIENLATSAYLWSANALFHRSVEVFHV
jgi:hypothetical protein